MTTVTAEDVLRDLRDDRQQEFIDSLYKNQHHTTIENGTLQQLKDI